MENVFADFLQNGGLYETITVTEDNVMDFCSLLGGKIKISIFCPKCKENRVFTMKPVTFRNNSGVLQKLGEEIYHNYEIYQSCKAVPDKHTSLHQFQMQTIQLPDVNLSYLLLRELFYTDSVLEKSNLHKSDTAQS